VRRRISFEAANLIGSPQDDVKVKGKDKSRVKSKVKGKDKSKVKSNIKTESQSEDRCATVLATFT